VLGWFGLVGSLFEKKRFRCKVCSVRSWFSPRAIRDGDGRLCGLRFRCPKCLSQGEFALKKK